MNILQQNYDVVVVGAGMVGAAMALGLAQHGWSVALLERHAPDAKLSIIPALRVSAIGCASVRLLKQLDVWRGIEQVRCAPYRRVETWEQPGNCVSFDAAALSLPELGFMVENQVVQKVLWQQLVNHPHIQLLCPSTLQGLSRTGHNWQLTLDTHPPLYTRLVLGADGAHSRVRQLAGLGTLGWQYRQSCLLITVETHPATQDVTWQQFFPSGPRAFLPLFGHWASLAWYDSPARIRQLQAMPLSQLNEEIVRAFPQRLGSIQAHAAGSFPLFRHHVSRYVRPGLVLLGDAAHSIHPLAGLGVNLGYRDVAVLLDVLNNARQSAQDFDSEAVLLRYQQRRRLDNLIMQGAMDALHAAFSNPLPMIKMVRNLALLKLQRSGWLKKQAIRYALGWSEPV